MPAEEMSPAVSPETLMERVEELTAEVDRIEDPSARRTAEELLGAVMDLYGEGLSRISTILDDEDGGVNEVKQKMAEDAIVASLMLIHDLYPVSIEERVAEALDSVRPYMESHGGNVELLSLEDGVASIRLAGSCDGCAASSSTLELAIKTALDEHAPDLTSIHVEGLEQDLLNPITVSGAALPMADMPADTPAAPGNGGAPVDASGLTAGPAWHGLDGAVDGLLEGDMVGVEVENNKLIVARVEGSLLAYMDSCPDCSSELSGGELSEGVLVCPSCSRSYFLPRAGRSMDDERLQLGPVPLLESQGQEVRVAFAR
jgi:Fe-S cluster biogenesis protein NfuA/nitrite reductase/ring-hydroxylating ferredoxin subunit